MPRLIAMLTHNDVTSPKSMEIFLGAKDAPCEYWGFKDVGLSEHEMRQLAETMKANGKTIFMESLAYSEQDTLKSLRLAANCGVEYFLGGTYYESAADFAAANGIRISPFLGLRKDGKLYGDIDELVAYAKERVKHNVFGINISAYRYEGDCEMLIKRLVAAVDKPISIAGSINSYERLVAAKDSGCWALTIGGAFFENKFGSGFSEQITNVVQILESTAPTKL